MTEQPIEQVVAALLDQLAVNHRGISYVDNDILTRLCREVEWLQKDLTSTEESHEAQLIKYEGCPHEILVGHSCACSYDHVSHVCAVHAPQLEKSQALIAELESKVEALTAQLKQCQEDEQ
jgi:hypothetical protein